jgi:anti-anti-sigma factor
VALYIEIEKRPDGELYRLTGRLDAQWAAELERQPPRPGGVVVIDLREVDYLSSAGVRIFVSWHKVLHHAGGRLILAAPQPHCREVLQISGLDQFLEIPESLPAAGDPPAA